MPFTVRLLQCYHSCPCLCACACACACARAAAKGISADARAVCSTEQSFFRSPGSPPANRLSLPGAAVWSLEGRCAESGCADRG